MSYQAYASPAELASYVGVPLGALPADVGRLLLRASTLIDTVPTLRSFDMDSVTGIPTDGDVAVAMSNAVCAQIEYWFEIGGGAQEASSAGEGADILRLPGDAEIGKTSIGALRKFAPRALDELSSVGMLRSGITQADASLGSSFFA